MTKICAKCKKNKDVSEFWSAGKRGKHPRCIECMREKHNAQRRKNHSEHKSRDTHYWLNGLKPRFWHYKTSAKRRKSRERLEFSLTLEQFAELTSKRCEYCNCFSPGKEHSGVDRVDDSKGYVLENCVPCCSVCNFMKRNMSVPEFLAHLEKVVAWCKGRTVKQENDNGPERNPGTAQEVAAAGQEAGEARRE